MTFIAAPIVVYDNKVPVMLIDSAGNITVPQDMTAQRLVQYIARHQQQEHAPKTWLDTAFPLGMTAVLVAVTIFAAYIGSRN